VPAVARAKGQKKPTAEVAPDAQLGQTVASASSPQAGSLSEKPRGDGHSNSHDTSTSFVLHFSV